jgi:hypothetical protein
VLCLGAIGLITLGRLTRDNRAHGTATAAAATLASVPTLQPSSVSADAVANAQATSAAAPNNTEATLQLGQAYYKAARFDEATATYNKAAGLSNYRAVFYTTNVIGPYANDPIFELTVLTDGLQHANLRVQTELWTLTAPILEQAAALPNSDAVLGAMVKDFPDQPWPLLALARHDIKFNRLDEAGPLVDQARQSFPDLPLTHFVYGEYLQAKGKTAGAQAEFEIVVANPKTAPALRQAAQKDLDTLKGTVTP